MAELDLKSKIEELLQAGKSYQEIGDELGISKGQAWKIVHGRAAKERKSEKEEKEQKQKESDMLVLLQRAMEILLKVRDYYIEHPGCVVDISRILQLYEQYLREKPEILLKVWLGIQEAFEMDLYIFLRNNGKDFLYTSESEGSYLILNHCFNEIIGGYFFNHLMIEEDIKYYEQERERKQIEARIAKEKERNEMFEIAKEMFEWYIDRSRKNLLFLKEALETETETETETNTGNANEKKEGDEI
jgi:hypothetical protein